MTKIQFKTPKREYSKLRLLTIVLLFTGSMILIVDLTYSYTEIDSMDTNIVQKNGSMSYEAEKGKCIVAKDSKFETIYRCYPVIDLKFYEYRTHGYYEEFGVKRTNKSLNNITGDING